MSWFFSMNDLTPEIQAKMRAATSKIVRKIALDIQAQAQQMAPVAQPPAPGGFLKSSIYTVTHTSSGYADAGSEGDGSRTLLPEVEAPATNQTAFIAVGAEYGVYQEYGTSKMAAQPYLTPAMDAIRPTFEAAMAALEAAMRAEGGGL